MHGAMRNFESFGLRQYSALPISELIYVGDALIVGADQACARQFMDCARGAGEHYGLSFNWGKLEVLPVRCQSIAAATTRRRSQTAKG
eukprot:8463157-Pyramimonas_sp.AAC.1